MKKLSFIFLSVFILTFPVSVTLSEGFSILSSFFLLIHKIRNREKPNLPKEFYALLILYAVLFFTGVFQNSEIPLYKKLFRSEISYVWMLFPFWTAFELGNEFKKEIIRVSAVSFLILLLSGAVSVFTPFRLAVWFQNGFSVPSSARLQHFAGNILGLNTYLPVGLMNTHLTYGGLLGIFFSGVILYFLWSIFLFFRTKVSSGALLRVFSVLILTLIFLSVLFYNQSRSVWIGCVFSFLIFPFSSDFLRAQIRNLFQKRKFSVRKLFLFFFLFGILFSGGIYLLIQKNWMLQRALFEAGKKNTTENQRYFIYRPTMDLISKNFWTGTGSGAFRKFHEQASEKYILEYEQLWYEMYITPRGHAHHDILHIQSVGGIFASLFYILFWLLVFRRLLHFRNSISASFFSGFTVLFPAGFFQCYMQDAEVLLPFFVSAGMYCALTEKNIRDRIHRKELLYPLLTVISLIFLSVFLTFSRISDSPFEVYSRKIRETDPLTAEKVLSSLSGSRKEKISLDSAEKGFSIEGCLTHRYAVKNPAPRQEDYSIALEIEESSENPPVQVQVHAVERDSFDQDQLYRAHSKKDLKNYEFTLQKGRNLLRFEGLLSDTPSKQFPENIYFRDFHFRFVPLKKKEMDLPRFDFGRLCDVKE
ncbi:MAG TPA: O-antigen ligase family protein [Leptospiraceae bacterium]|nr:O-antigen ligase family protein [Leptospiraceae bacterium]